MEYLLPAFHMVASVDVLLAIFIGVLVGTVVGALPGLGPTLGVTLALPFTFGMEPTAAIALMLAIYCASTYGGSISAVLINTPGTAASAATSLDGFPMVKDGKADLALGWVTVSSVIGGLLSIIVLALLAPQLAAVALKFGPSQTFALILLAMTCMASVSRGSMIKGLMAGLFGIFLATIGPDPVTGDLRLDFGVFELSAGLSLVPIIVGIFALAEVLDRAAHRHAAVDVGKLKVGFRLAPFVEWRARTGLLFKSSMIGAFVGSLPGTGSAIASFLSYAEAKRTSPRRDRLGHGEPDGIVASEAANNAVTGGTLVPTLALGIPGDSVTAVMMSSFLIHGVSVGVRLFTDSPVMVYSMFESLVVINQLLLVAGILGAQCFTRLLRMPEPLLMGIVTVLSFVGAYSARGNSFDVVVMLGAGVLGFIMRRGGYPVAPLVIGFVLGPAFEENLRTALVLADYKPIALVADPIVLGLLCVTVIFLLAPVLKEYWLARRAARNPTP